MVTNDMVKRGSVRIPSIGHVRKGSSFDKRGFEPNRVVHMFGRETSLATTCSSKWVSSKILLILTTLATTKIVNPSGIEHCIDNMLRSSRSHNLDK